MAIAGWRDNHGAHVLAAKPLQSVVIPLVLKKSGDCMILLRFGERPLSGPSYSAVRRSVRDA